MEIIQVKVSTIKVGDRLRKDRGDLQGLAQSIKEGDLLQPIGVTPDNELVFGERRLIACRDILGWEDIPARIIDVESVLLGQVDENCFRKDYTLSEKVAIVDSLGSFEHGGDRRSKEATNSRLDSMTLGKACKLVGLTEDGYRSIKTINENGVLELVADLDSGRVSVYAAEVIAEASPEDQRECLKKRLDAKRLTKKAVEKHLTRISNQRKRDEMQATAIKAVKRTDNIRIHHCPFQKLESLAKIEPESASLVCTDIPYAQDFHAQLDELGQFAERVLVGGGIFVTYSGQYWLPQVMESFGRHLNYRWMIASVWEGDANIANPLKVASQFKPILVFSKGDWPDLTRWSDLQRSTEKEKEWHPWQQCLSEVENLVRSFSKPGDLIIDPCAGGFTTAIACLKQNRRFVGCDVDKVAVVAGQERLAVERQKVVGRTTEMTPTPVDACQISV
jgi:ParB/RepB/Spo0J family partition protein